MSEKGFLSGKKKWNWEETVQNLRISDFSAIYNTFTDMYFKGGSAGIRDVSQNAKRRDFGQLINYEEHLYLLQRRLKLSLRYTIDARVQSAYRHLNVRGSLSVSSTTYWHSIETTSVCWNRSLFVLDVNDLVMDRQIPFKRTACHFIAQGHNFSRVIQPSARSRLQGSPQRHLFHR